MARLFLSQKKTAYPFLTRVIPIHENSCCEIQGFFSADTGIWPESALQSATPVSEKIITSLTEELDLAFVVSAFDTPGELQSASIVANVLREQETLSVAIRFGPADYFGCETNIENSWPPLARKFNTVLQSTYPVLFPSPGSDCAARADLSEAELDFLELYRCMVSTFESVLIGVDFADLCLILSSPGTARFGRGVAHEEGILAAASRAIEYPGMGAQWLSHASGVLVAIEGSPDALQMRSISAALEEIQKTVSTAATIIFGGTPQEALRELSFCVSIFVHTGLSLPSSRRRR